MEAEDIRKKFAELPAKGIGWTSLFALSVILFAVQATEKLLKGTEFVSTLILAGIVSIGGHDATRTWLVLLVSALIVLPVFLLILLAHAAMAKDIEHKKLLAADQSKQSALHCLTETMYAASVIRSRQTPDASHTVKTLEEIRVEYRVAKDFTMTLTKQFTVKAAGEALHFWETSIQPSSKAYPMEYLTDIQFKVSDVTDPKNRKQMTYLQTQNDPRIKRICIYFLPRLLKADPARVIEIGFKWPKYLLQLQQEGREDLFQSFNSAGPTQNVTIDIWFEDGNGGSCGLDVVSTYDHELLPLKETGWSGFRYQAKSLPPGRQEHKLSATWTRS